MKRFTDVFEDFLKANPELREPPQLGGRTPTVRPEQIAFLSDQLKLASRQNSRIVVVLVVLYVAMLVGGFVIVFTSLHEPKIMRSALGGSFLSLLVILKGLQSLWREQNGFTVMIPLLAVVPPEQALKIAETHFYKAKIAASK